VIDWLRLGLITVGFVGFCWLLLIALEDEKKSRSNRANPKQGKEGSLGEKMSFFK